MAEDQDTGAKTPNVRLKSFEVTEGEGADATVTKTYAEPITVSGTARVGMSQDLLTFPTLERQQNGWCAKDAKRIVACYGDRYELIDGGCNC